MSDSTLTSLPPVIVTSALPEAPPKPLDLRLPRAAALPLRPELEGPVREAGKSLVFKKEHHLLPDGTDAARPTQFLLNVVPAEKPAADILCVSSKDSSTLTKMCLRKGIRVRIIY